MNDSADYREINYSTTDSGQPQIHYESLPEISVNNSSRFSSRYCIIVLGLTVLLGIFVFYSFEYHQFSLNSNNYRYTPETKNPVKDIVDTPSQLNHYDTKPISLQQVEDVKCRRGAIRNANTSESCLGPPYLYVTFHGGFAHHRLKTVCKFTRDGCAMGAVLEPSTQHEIHSLRGMTLVNDTLIVAEAWRKNSRILQYGTCNEQKGNRRELLKVLIDGNQEGFRGLLHPYGFAVRPDDDYIYVTTQGTSLVLKYNMLTGLPANISNSHSDASTGFGPDAGTRHEHKYNGTFVSIYPHEIRGLTFDKRGFLYVADKNEGVLIFDENGAHVGILPEATRSPISVYYDSNMDSIWVSSAKKHILYEFDASTHQLIKKIKHQVLRHPAGLVIYQDSLFVISQERDMLLEFSTTSGEILKVIHPSLPDTGERVILSDC